jgi:pimeloyl-ACP methyl ester carboxylesterase
MKSVRHGLLVMMVVSSCALRAATFDSAGVSIHYEVQGAGEPVVLIHGLGSYAAENWDMPGITSLLAQRYKVITFDCRGHGQSDKPLADGSYGVNMVEDVVRLLDHLHIRQSHVVGYSMGGMITMKLLTMYPRRVRSAVLGGMGWLREGSPVQAFLSVSQGWGSAPAACVRELGHLAVTEEEIRTIRTPVTIITGSADPLRWLFITPLEPVRPDWPVYLVEGAGHVDCVIRPEFKTFIEAALASIPPMKYRYRPETPRRSE